MSKLTYAAFFTITLLLFWATPVLAVPPTPTNAARAHPLAPNPHTSVGLFWIYIDANTGRRWTGGTYKVKRCSGAGCTPTTVIVSGLTNADYQDTGLSTNTTYGYRYVANDGTDSGDSPTVYVTTLSADSNMVQFPNSVWAELLGPLPEESQIPFAYYDDSASTRGQAIIAQFPVVAPSGGTPGTGHLSGTGSINNGSTTLTGSGTFFLEQVAANNPTCLDRISINGVDAGAIASVDSNTQITLVTPWASSNVSGVIVTTNVPGLCGFTDPLGDYIVGNQLMYYDSPMALWQKYFSSGDPQYLRGAERGSESIFAGWMHLGRNRDALGNVDTGPPPRNIQFSGLLLYGLAGHDGVWDQLDSMLSINYPKWLSNYRGGSNDFSFVREKAYMILFTSWFVSAAPDSFKRSDGSTTSLNGGTTVDGSLATGRKGFYRDQLDIDVPGFITDDQTAFGFWQEVSYYGDFADGYFPNRVSQPFIQGLVGDAVGYCWRNPNLASGTRTAARKLVLKVAAAMGHLSYNTNVIPNEPSVRNRTIYYFYEGGTDLNPFMAQYGSDTNSVINWGGSNFTSWDRQSIPLMLSTFGWAWEMSGHAWYKTMGDEMANAAFAAVGENTGGTGDGKKSLCGDTSNAKDYGQCYRTSRRYFGARLLSPSSLGTPPSVSMPSNQTLTSGVNQVTLTASVTCTNTPCAYRWVLKEYPQVQTRRTAMPVISPNNALTAQISGLESGVYKFVFYALDALGLEGNGEVSVTMGDGQFPPIVVMGGTSQPPVESVFVPGTSVSGKVYAYSVAGRSLTHSFSFIKPKDKSAPTITPSATTGNTIDLTVSNLSNGFYAIFDTVTDSAGLVRKAVWFIHKADTAPPSNAHNTVPAIVGSPNSVLPAGSTSTVLQAVPIDPEGVVGFATGGTGYILGPNGGEFMVTALSHSWSQVAGPVTATISNGSTIRPTISGLTQAGTYTFRYSGTDQQGDGVTIDFNVVAQSSPTVTVMNANLQHGQGTDLTFNFQRQVDAFVAHSADIVAVQERSTTEGGWNSPLSTAGYTQAVYLENNTTEQDGPALWVKTATVTVDQVYSKALVTGTNPSCGSPNVGWDCSTDVRKSAVAAKVTVSGRQFYVVSVHGCWSRCNNSSGTTVSVQRENQMNDLVSWISSTLTGGLDVVILGDLNFGPDYAKSTGGLIKDILTAGYTDLWNAGMTASVATAPWNDRDGVGGADMPVGDLTTRTHDTRRIDYIFLKTGATSLSLSSISVPDLRATCPHGLVAGGTFPSCSPEVNGGPGVSGQQWDIPDDFGVRPSDHNFVKAVLTIASGGGGGPSVICNWHTTARCQ